METAFSLPVLFDIGAVWMVDFAKNLPDMHCGSYLTAHWIPVPLEQPAGQILSGSDHLNSPNVKYTSAERLSLERLLFGGI